MAVAITPLTTMPSRKSAGSRKRSDLSIGPYTVALGVHGVPCRADFVADAPHGDDRGGLAELAPQLPHVHVHRTRVTREGVAPDALEQLVAREHEAAMVEELPEQVELLRRQLDLLVADLHLATSGVDAEIAVPESRARDFLAVGGGAAKDRLHARDELARVERLRQIVVRADLQPDDLVDVLV